MDEPISDCGGVWEPGEDGNKKMPKTVMSEMKENSENGIVISGVVAWVAMQMDMNAEGVWMELAEACWSELEVTKAKKVLKAACGDNLKEHETFNKDRKQRNKELGDIRDGLRFLKNKEKMPLILADVVMMKRCPQPGFSVKQTNEDIVERINIFEKAMNHFMVKTEKYMEESKEQVEKLNEAVTKTGPKTPILPLLQVRVPDGQDTPTKKRRLEETGSVTPALEQQQYSSVVAGVAPLNSQQQEQIRNMQQLLNNQKKQHPAKQRNICYGTAKPADDSGNKMMLAADINLVASGLDQECNEEKLKEFLIERGIKPVKVEMMKKPNVTEGEDVRTWRTKSFKVTVKAAEHEKAMKPETWPYRVAVRYWRAERRPRPGGWDRQAGTSGGQVGGGQAGAGQAGGWQQQPRNRQDSEGWQHPWGRGGSVRNAEQTQSQQLEISNIFNLLQSHLGKTVVNPTVQ